VVGRDSHAEICQNQVDFVKWIEIETLKWTGITKEGDLGFIYLDENPTFDTLEGRLSLAGL
jgi:hypothetical protein